MPVAKWNGVVIAESARCEQVEGNCYFPADAIRREYFRPSDTHTVCPWKGTASYYDVVVNGQVNKDAACTTRSRSPPPPTSPAMSPSGAG
jgi:uncharacterized protein (DUF427 family)